MTTGKTIALTRRTFVGKVMSLLFNMLSRLVITILPRSKSQCLVITYNRKESEKLYMYKYRRRQWQPTPVLLPGKSHGRRSLAGYSPWGRQESDTTKRLHFHFSPSCTGEGSGNLLHYSCLENPRDREAWWVAVYGFTRLKRLSSSSRLLESRELSLLLFSS